MFVSFLLMKRIFGKVTMVLSHQGGHSVLANPVSL